MAVEQRVKEDSIPDGEIPSPIQKRAQYTHLLSSFLFDLIDVRRPDESCIWAHSKITSCVDPLDWLPKSVNGLGLLLRRPALAKIIVVLFKTFMAILHSVSHHCR